MSNQGQQSPRDAVGGESQATGVTAGLADVSAIVPEPASAATAAPDSADDHDHAPTVSVIVPIYNVEDYLAGCMDSILGQRYTDFEVIVVDDGSPDGSAAIAAEYAERDDRVRIVRRANGGLGAARNTGIREATGRYLTFVDSDDELPLGALGRMVTSAEESGSDMVVGSMRRFNSLELWKPRWIDGLHGRPRTSIVIDDLPGLVRNNYTWAKLYRADFWRECDLWFREGVAYEDQPLVTALYLRARGIDVVRESVYRYRSRDDKSSISQQTATIRDLRDRVEAWRTSQRKFADEASPAVYDAWLTTLFDAHFHWYLRSPATVDDTYWRILQEAVAELTHEAPRRVWESVAPDRRVVIELARRNRRDDVLAFYEGDGAQGTAHPVEPSADGLVCALPFSDDPSLPHDLFTMDAEQLVLDHEIHDIRWTDGVTLQMRGWAYLRQVDLATYDTRVEIVLRDTESGRERAYPATRDPAPGYPAPVEHARMDYGAGAFVCNLDLEHVVNASVPAGRQWEAYVRAVTGDVAREVPVRRLIRSSSAGNVESGVHVDGHRVTVEWHLGQHLALQIEPQRVEAFDVTVSDRRLVGTLRGPGADEIVFVEFESHDGEPLGNAKVLPDDDGRRSFDLPLPPPPDYPTMAANEFVGWGVHAEFSSGERVPVMYQGERQLEFARDDGDGVRAVERTRVGTLAVAEWAQIALADDMYVDAHDALHVRGRLHGAHPEHRDVRLRLRSRKTVVSSGRTAHTDGTFALTLPLTYDAGSRFGTYPLPPAAHDLSCELLDDAGNATKIPVQLSQEAGSRLPVAVRTPHLDGRIIRGPKNRVRLHLGRPVHDARGKYRQDQLRRTLGVAPRCGPRRALLVRSYFGETATGNGVGILRELQRRDAPVDVYWAVTDFSVPVPDGARAVAVNSREWYDLLGSAKYYMDNMFQPQYYRKPPEQVLIQTFHGYPFKTMGIPLWEQSGASTRTIQSYQRRVAEWDYLVSPAEYATPLLRRDFGYDGTVLEIGYPRNDVLLAGDASGVRADVRASLGIEPGQRAVLYAPTFRDYESPDDHRAALVDLLDLDAVADGLGDDAVLLVRGHAFNARAGERARVRPGIIEVTDYPEVADLCLAADMAIMDYSSLRFDFAVTGKPMVFHVPDLQRYRETRGWLVDYETTAPGPLTTSTDDVLAHVHNPDRLRREYGSRYAAFRSEFLALEDGGAAARFVDEVFVPRGDAPPAQR